MVADSSSSGVAARVGVVGAYTGGSDLKIVRRARALTGHVTVAGRSGLGAMIELRKANDLYGVDLDPACYLERDATQSELFPRDWEDDQRRLDVPVVRSAGIFVGRADQTALRNAFLTPVGKDTVRVVSLDATWLSSPGHAQLLSYVRGAEDPLAFVFASPFDPFDSAKAIDGLRQLLDAATPGQRRVELLRTDIAGLGFVAAGGALGTIGLSTSTRHHGLPLGKQAGKTYGQRVGIPKVFVLDLLSWQSGTTLGALTPFGGAGLTRCEDGECAGQSLLRFDRQWPGAVPAEVRADAAAHDLHSWLAVASATRAAEDPLQAWRKACAAAVTTADAIAAQHKVRITVPTSVASWV